MSASGREKRSLLAEYGFAIGISMVLALLIRFFLIEAFKVPTTVMKPSLLPGDYIFASKISYGVKIPFSREYLFMTSVPEYGDVVVYQSGNDRENLIKRVIGLPGDNIEIKNGRLIFNGQELRFEAGKTPSCGHEYHPKYSYNVCYEPPYAPDVGPFQVPPKSLFVMADYRVHQVRRKVGEVISVNSVKAKALWVWLSIQPKAETDQMRWIPEIRFDRVFSTIH